MVDSGNGEHCLRLLGQGQLVPASPNYLQGRGGVDADHGRVFDFADHLQIGGVVAIVAQDSVNPTALTGRLDLVALKIAST
jgi:hypothetical protein